MAVEQTHIYIRRRHRRATEPRGRAGAGGRAGGRGRWVGRVPGAGGRTRAGGRGPEAGGGGNSITSKQVFKT